MASIGSATGLALFNDQTHSAIHCRGCLLGKMHRIPFSSTRIRATRAGQVIHSDVCGPMEVATPTGARYYVVFKDDYSGWCEVQLIQRKSEVPAAFKKFTSKLNAQTGEEAKTLRSDGGGEFCSNDFRDWLADSGITHLITPPYTPQLNGVSERANRTIVESARSQMYEKNVPLELWGLAVQCAIYVQNRSISSTNNSTPYQLWHGREPDVSHLKVFGCLAFVHIPVEKRKKLQPKAVQGMMVGYCEGSSSLYRIWDPAARELITSRDVIFEEGSTCETTAAIELDYYSLFPQEPVEIATDMNAEPPSDQAGGEAVDLNPAQVDTNPDRHEERTEANRPGDTLQEEDDDGSDEEQLVDDPFYGFEDPPHHAPPPTANLRRSKRIQIQKEKLRPLRVDQANRATKGATHPPPKILGKQALSLQEALSSEDGELWRTAVEDEYDSLMKNGTWEVVPLPPGRATVKCRWVFEIKPGYEGVPERYKARLVAKGFTQKYGVDYNETFAPVVKLPTLRTILALVAANDLEVLQLDVKTAFLYGHLDEEIYMRQPEGYVLEGRENEVCRLIKSIYGLKQAPRAWNIELNDAISGYGLIRSQEDQCLYYRRQGEDWLAALFFVDDAFICGTSQTAIEDFANHLKKKFEIRILPAERFLGLTINRNRNKKELSISQPDYVDSLIKKFRMENCHPRGTPAEPGQRLCSEMAPKNEKDVEKMKKVPYQKAVGALLYLSTTTRPDIAYSVSKVAQFSQNPGILHWTAVKRIFRYLAGTRNYGIVFSPKEEGGVTGFTDADLGGDVDDRKSTSGCVFLCHGGATSWFSRKQECTSISTTEAEFVAGSEAAKEATWIRALLKEIGQRGSEPITLCCDNQGAIRVANNPELHKKMKHIDIRFRYIQQALNTGVIQVHYVNSKNQVADILTKPLPSTSFKYLREKLGVMDITAI